MCFDLKKKLSKEIELIFSKITLINTFIVFYRQLIDIKSTESEKYNIGKNFFDSVTHAYDYGIICELAVLYSLSEQKGSLYSVLKFCDKNKAQLITDDEDNAFLECKLKEIEEMDTKDIKEYRDKSLAHCDKKYFGKTNKLLTKYPFKLERFEFLNNYVAETLNELYYKVTKENHSFGYNLITGYDLNDIIKSIK